MRRPSLLRFRVRHSVLPTRTGTSRAVLVPVVAVVALTACGPATSLKIGMNARAAAVYFGSPSSSFTPSPLAEAPPPALLPVSTGPNAFAPISAPGIAAVIPSQGGTPTATPSPRACPGANPAAPMPIAAPIPSAPHAGTYLVQRTGWIKAGPSGSGMTDDQVKKLPATTIANTTEMTVANVLVSPVGGPTPQTGTGINAGGDEITYDVKETDEDTTVTTSFMVMPAGYDTWGNFGQHLSGGGALKITKILLQNPHLPGPGPFGQGTPNGTETYNAPAGVRIMAVPSYQFYGADDSGDNYDPSEYGDLRVFSQIDSAGRFAICDTWYPTWKVLISVFGEMSTYSRPGLTGTTFQGYFLFSPSLGLIVAQDMEMWGVSEVGQVPYHMHVNSQITQLPQGFQH